MKKTVLLAMAAFSVALALTACSAGSDTPTSPPTPSGDIQGGTQPTTKVPLTAFPDSDELAAWCPLDVEAVHLHQLEVTVSSAAVCSTSVGDDGFATTTVSAVSGGLDELLTAYAVPNAPVDASVVCTLQLEDPLLVWLTYPGERSYPVYAPVGPCGFPTDEAKAAFAGLTLTPVVSFAETSSGVTTTDIGLGVPEAPAKETI
ncbi:hypothetical protein SAMN06295879_3250 [Agreia bicolorata]|uniref:Lipoprotein n=1 Tax=Agreia bicolorata TaxID=110935 RepID=A0A1T4YIB4_9MICO|nr:hypothetical protein [Agreia bicolorata]SKB01453.1 hypothetical protein SAMN06295879_3250 [Agreia bicolorata]